MRLARISVAILMASTLGAFSSLTNAAEGTMGKANQSKTVYSVNDETVSLEKFETLLKTLTEVEGTRTSGESPRGGFFSYRARSKDSKEYLVKGDGSKQSIQGPLP